MANNRSVVGIVLAALVILISLTPQARFFYSLPNTVKLGVGDTFNLKFKLPAGFDDKFVLEYAPPSQSTIWPTKTTGTIINFSSPVVVTTPGEANLKLKLFGIIPVKNIELNVLPRLKLIPGGHAIGILLKTNGITVVGFSPIEDQDGLIYSPAQQEGIEIGDVIEAIEGIALTSDENTSFLIEKFAKKGKPINLKIKRGSDKLNIKVNPIYCKSTNKYRIGLYIRDSTAGVGTLTFFDPTSSIYGALGHVISDADVNKQISKGEGKIVDAKIKGIQQAIKGQPGEKIGSFENNKGIFGDIHKNTNYGIFGTLNTKLINKFYQNPIPVAFAEEVVIGPAKILTVIEGNEIEEFNVEITKTNVVKGTNGKNLMLKITDPKLLELTGGIIQGMSGSPIIQNGMLVGAVTHVLVNDPTRGYGILAETMLLETDLFRDKKGAA